eukprot:6516086-Pyramimonas_sp.AAC.1
MFGDARCAYVVPGVQATLRPLVPRHCKQPLNMQVQYVRDLNHKCALFDWPRASSVRASLRSSDWQEQVQPGKLEHTLQGIPPQRARSHPAF